MKELTIAEVYQRLKKFHNTYGYHGNKVSIQKIENNATLGAAVVRSGALIGNHGRYKWNYKTPLSLQTAEKIREIYYELRSEQRAKNKKTKKPVTLSEMAIQDDPAVDAIGNKVEVVQRELTELTVNTNGRYRELQSDLSNHINQCGDERLEFLSLRERVKTLESERVVMIKEINLLFDHLNEMETPKTGIIRRAWRWLW